MARCYVHLTYEQRLKIKQLLNLDSSKQAIADCMGVHISTIYREIARGNCNGQYDPDYAEKQYQANLKEKGHLPLLDENPELAEYIADMILLKKLSPEKIVEILKQENKFTKIPCSKETIYKNIDEGKIPGVTRDSLRKKDSRIFSNGQIIIPKWVLEKLDLKDGDELHLEVSDEGKIIYQKKK